MSPRRILLRAALVGLLFLPPVPAAAQGDGQITVQVSPNELPARPDPNAQAQVSISINIPTTVAPGPGDRPTPGDPGEPFFTVAATPSGTLTPDPQYPAPTPFRGMPGNPLMFEILRPRDGGTRTSGEAHYLYRPAPDPEPGEVIITVEGGQGLTMGGVGAHGTTRFRGQARLILTAVPGGRAPREPTTRPPFTRTPGAVNPPDAMLQRLGPLVLLLPGIALTNWAVTRSGRKPRPKAGPDGKKKPPDREPPPEIKAPPAGCDLVVVSTSGPHLGNGKYELHFRVSAVPSAGWNARFLGLPRWAAEILPPGRFQPDAEGTFRPDFNASDYGQVIPDTDPPAYNPIDVPGTAHLYYKLRLPWEWRDVEVKFSVTARAELTQQGGVQRKQLGPVTGAGTVPIVGANPEIVITPEPLVVNATGRDGTELEVTTFLLFGEPATPEDRKQLHIIKAGVTDLDIGGDRPEDAAHPEPQQPPGEWWGHVVRKGEKAEWVPPFLVQEPGHGELFELEIQCAWTGPDGKWVPLPPTQCEVTLLGCDAEVRPEGRQALQSIQPGLGRIEGWLQAGPKSPEDSSGDGGLYFLPLPGESLFASGKVKAGGKGVNNPLGDGAIHSPHARITCEVRDLSQGVPTRWNGCKLPPKHLFDVGAPPEPLPSGPDEVTAGDDGRPGPVKPKAPHAAPEPSEEEARRQREKVIQGILMDPEKAPLVSEPVVLVDQEGRLLTPGCPYVQLWKYAARSRDHEPIENGPVVYTFIVDDGLGGKVEVRGACYAMLGRLVMETGGPDFRIYEYRPYCFDAHYEHPLGYFPDQEVELRWEFSLVDREGNPVQWAASLSTQRLADPAHTRFDFLAGHLPDHRDLYLSQTEAEPEIKSYPRGHGDAAWQPGWRRIEQADRELSTVLCSSIHTARRGLSTQDLQKTCVEEPALPWMANVDPIPWKDQTLFMAVRVEMRKDGHLLATSDRLAPSELATPGGSSVAGRTPPEYVWRDHQFRFVVAMLRVRLQDDTGQPYADRPYRLELDGKAYPDEPPLHYKTGELGQLEQVVPLGVERLKLVLHPDKPEPGGEFRLQLGHLDPVTEDTGVAERLNNLGLFAGAPARFSGRPGQLERGVERFQVLRDLPPTGQVDDVTRRALQVAHDETGVIRERRSSRREVAFQASAGDAVAQMRKEPPTVDNPLKPAPPDVLAKRKACVALHVPNTLRVPCDLPRKVAAAELEWKRWFEEDGQAPPEHEAVRAALKSGKNLAPAVPLMNPVKEGNEVLYLIDGPETFRSMAEAIGKASGPGDYIYLLGWFLDMDFQLFGNKTGPTINELFTAAAGYSPSIEAIRDAERATHEAATGAAKAAADAAAAVPRSSTLTRGSVRKVAAEVKKAAREAREAATAASKLREAALKVAGAGVGPAAAALQASDAAGAAAETAADTAGSSARRLARKVSQPGEDQPDAAAPVPGRSQVEEAVRAAGDAAAAAQAAAAAIEAAVDALTQSLVATDAGARGKQVQVRAVLWKSIKPGSVHWNVKEVARINALTHGAAILDNLTEGVTGAHHQKVLVVRHGNEFTAFCGGIDINPDRLLTYREQNLPLPHPIEPAPFHDVHCRIRGPAARDLLHVFLDRWDNHPDHEELDRRHGDLLGRNTPASATPPNCPQYQHVQIGRTFAIPSELLRGIPTQRYQCAPQGERTAWRMIRHAIRQAERFIYLEDQYLTSEAARDVLLARLGDGSKPPLEHVTILIPRDAHTDMWGWQGPLRREFLDPLRNKHPEIVRAFYLVQPATGARPADWHTYIHTKMWIIDDRYAIIGSANCNNRSYGNDAEVVAGIFGGPGEEYCAYYFAHQLRVAVWAELLNMDTAEGHAELADGVASVVHWLHPPPGARVAEYPISQVPVPTGLPGRDDIDPKGSSYDPP